MLRRLGALCLHRLGAQQSSCQPCLPGATAAAGWPAELQTLSALAAAASGSAQQLQTSAPLQQEFISLNNISDNPGATKTARRLGRGIGSSKGKTAGRGHKGQKARSGRDPKPGFEGGQTPLRLRVAKKGFYNPFSRWWQPLNLDRLQKWVVDGRIDVSQVVTMKDLRDSGAVHKNVKDGVKLLATGAEQFDVPLHIQVSQASEKARAAVAAAGGSVTTVYYNKLGLKALLQPDWFPKKGRLLPRPARPPPKLEGRFDVRGSLPPDLTMPAAAAAATG